MTDDIQTPEVGANDNTRSDADSGVSMMITRRQRAALLALGFSEVAIFDMTPSQAHGHLGLTT